MELTIRQREYDKYLTILQILANLTNPTIRPFNSLRNRELEVFAVILYLYHDKYGHLPVDEKYEIIFSYETRVEISNLLDGISLASVYNIMMNLRKHGLITKQRIIKEYLIPNTDFIKINFTQEN